MIDWLMQKLGFWSHSGSDRVSYRLSMSKSNHEALLKAVDRSSHDLRGFLSEAMNIAATCYREGHKGNEIIVVLQPNNTLSMYIEREGGPDDDGGEPVPVEDANVIDFLTEVKKRAA